MKTRHIASCLAAALCFTALGCDEGAEPIDQPGPGTTGTTSQELIDNMEDPERGGSIIDSADGRVGAWYTYNDETPSGVQTPPAAAFEPDTLEVPREGSKYAARSTGEGFIGWGAGFGFDLKNNGTSKLAYDASGYKGITFWAMTTEGNSPDVHVTFNDISTSPEGGVCEPDTEDSCDDHFGANIVLERGAWKEYTLLFSDLTQEGWGRAAEAFSPNALFAIQFNAGTNVKFDIWIDDIAFVE